MLTCENLIKAAVTAIAFGTVVACGGGGSDAGTSPFGTNSGTAASGVAGNAPGGGISVVSNRVPSQKYMSIAVKVFNLDWSFDGATTELTVRVADSAGNPVPEGTVVQFSTEGGQIQKSCRLTGSTDTGSTLSVCSVTFGTQELRPLDRLVSIVAWMEGEEAYADTNGNGQYDQGEPFYDSGKIFRDDDFNFAYTAGVDEINVGGTVGTPELGTGTVDCTLSQPSSLLNDVPMSVANTCDGKWGKTLVRANVTLAVSDPRTLGAKQDVKRDFNGVPILDGNGRTIPGLRIFSTSFVDDSIEVAAPFGTTIAAVGALTGCTVSISPTAVSATAVRPSFHAVTTFGTCPASIGFKVAYQTNEVLVSYTPPPGP